jgi:hypothetical protein
MRRLLGRIGVNVERIKSLLPTFSLSSALNKIQEPLSDAQHAADSNGGEYTIEDARSMFEVVYGQATSLALRVALAPAGGNFDKEVEIVAGALSKNSTPKGFVRVEHMDANLDDMSDCDATIYRFPKSALMTFEERAVYGYDESFDAVLTPLSDRIQQDIKLSTDPRSKVVLRFLELVQQAAAVESDRRKSVDDAIVLVRVGNQYTPSTAVAF